MHANVKFDKTLLGRLTPRQFLRMYWQKKPLLVPGALPGFCGTVSTERLFQLASRDEVESRLVSRTAGRWRVAHGPFNALPRKKSGWTLLVQGVNLHDSATDALMRRFNFISDARLDDVMISFAADGGGVGPHFDEYDVFLLQGEGKRRWRIGAQTDLDLVAGAPLKILRDFVPEQEFVLHPGDVLYLPPRFAHEGVALGRCTTYSIGFRAPSFQDLVREFLADQSDHLEVSGRYADPARTPSSHPAKIEDDLVESAFRRIATLRWTENDVGDFLGRYLTEPKPQVFFDQKRGISPGEFKRRIETTGVKLDLKSRMLYRGRKCFINGELVPSWSPGAQADYRSRVLRRLADRRLLSAEECAEIRGDAELLGLLLDWYADGWLTENV